MPFGVIELAHLDRAWPGLVPEICVIKRSALVSDGMGGHTQTEQTVATAPCRVAPADLMRGEERFAERFQDSTPYRATLLTAADVKSHDWFEIGGRIFEPMAIRAYRMQDVVSALCKERVT